MESEKYYIIVTNFNDCYTDLYGLVHYKEGYLCEDKSVTRDKLQAKPFDSVLDAESYAKKIGKSNFRVAQRIEVKKEDTSEDVRNLTEMMWS